MIKELFNIGQSSKRIDKQNYYDWSIWIEEDTNVLEEIKNVTYYLHKTFPDPVRRIEDSKSKFILETGGWGTFLIRITIELKNGVQSNQSHYLTLKKDYDSTKEKSSSSNEFHSSKKTKSVFVSYSSIDQKIARKIQIILEDNGIEVIQAIDTPKGESVNQFIQNSIEKASALIAIESDFDSPWQKDEIGIAKKDNIIIYTIAHKEKSVIESSDDKGKLFSTKTIKTIINELK